MTEAINFTPIWGLPFLVLVLGIAVFPAAISEHAWDKLCGYLALFAITIFAVPLAFKRGFYVALEHIAEVLMYEYIPFALLIAALYTTAYGIRVQSRFITGRPLSNACFLLVTAFMSSIMGTTGASVVFIRPFLNANAHKKHRVHYVIFFIILVSNAGGALTPLGDPPLFLGYLMGIHFLWFGQHMLLPLLVVMAVVLPIFLVLDWVLYRYFEPESGYYNPIYTKILKVNGLWHFLLTLSVSGALVGSGLIADKHLSSLFIALVLLLILCAAILLNRQAQVTVNSAPLMEVVKIFVGIFITSIPVMVMLKSGDYNTQFPLSLLHDASLRPNPATYFWVTGLLSSVLDNAPTYIIFFNSASGDPSYFMNTKEGGRVLLAISTAAVFMGCLTYIGNAPNLMIKSLAVSSYGIRMPSMLLYTLITAIITIPAFYIVCWLFIMR